MHNEELHYLQFSPNDICDQIKADEIFLAYGTYVEEEICVQDFGEENWRVETTWKTQSYKLEDRPKERYGNK